MAVKKSVKWLIAVPVALVAVVVVGTWGYIHFIHEDAPDRFTVDSDTGQTGASTTDGSAQSTGTTAGTSAAASPNGTWKVGSGSAAGYRVKEILFGQSTEGFGRTKNVTGTIRIAGKNVTTGSFTVDMTTVASKESGRDRQFKGRIMDVATYPTATFELTKPIDFGSVPAEGKKITAKATGKFTLHGTTKTITFEVEAKRTGSTIRIAGTIPVVFDEYGIPNPSGGPAKTEDHGEVEFLLVLTR